jgi:hypothetical protein
MTGDLTANAVQSVKGAFPDRSELVVSPDLKFAAVRLTSRLTIPPTDEGGSWEEREPEVTGLKVVVDSSIKHCWYVR